MKYTEHAIHKEIVDTFFKKSAPKKPLKSPKNGKRQTRLLVAALMAGLALAFFIIISILYIRRQSSYNKPPPVAKSRYSENIIRRGQINRANIEEIYFEGDAKARSSLLKNSIRLVNSVGSGKASLVVRFRAPLNFDGKNILLLARAGRGTKEIKLILKDSENHSYAFPNMRISSEWSLKHAFARRKTGFDLKRIKELEFELGKRATGNKNNSVIYIKNIIVRGAL